MLLLIRRSVTKRAVGPTPPTSSLIPSHLQFLSRTNFFLVRPLDSSFIRPLHLFAAGENGKNSDVPGPCSSSSVSLAACSRPDTGSRSFDPPTFRLFFSLRQPLSSRETKGEEDEADGLTEYVAGIARLSCLLERRLNKAALSFSPSDRPGTGRSSGRRFFTFRA